MKRYARGVVEGAAAAALSCGLLTLLTVWCMDGAALTWGVIMLYIAAVCAVEACIGRRRTAPQQAPFRLTQWQKLLPALPYFAAAYGLMAWLLTL